MSLSQDISKLLLINKLIYCQYQISKLISIYLSKKAY